MQYLKMIAQHANSCKCRSHYVCHYCLSPLLPCFWKLFSVSQQKLPICVGLILKCFVNMSLLWNERSVKGQAFVGVSTACWKGRGQECLITSQGFRCALWAARIPVWDQRRCKASVDPLIHSKTQYVSICHIPSPWNTIEVREFKVPDSWLLLRLPHFLCHSSKSDIHTCTCILV